MMTHEKRQHVGSKQAPPAKDSSVQAKPGQGNKPGATQKPEGKSKKSGQTKR